MLVQARAQARAPVDLLEVRPALPLVRGQARVPAQVVQVQMQVQELFQTLALEQALERALERVQMLLEAVEAPQVLGLQVELDSQAQRWRTWRLDNEVAEFEGEWSDSR